MKLFGQTTSQFSTTHSVTKAWTESKAWSPSLYHQPWAEKVVSMNFSLAPPPMHTWSTGSSLQTEGLFHLRAFPLHLPYSSQPTTPLQLVLKAANYNRQ